VNGGTAKLGIAAPLALAGLWSMGFALACHLAGGVPAGDPAPGGIALQALGASRSALADRLIESADRTFHRGVGPYRRAAFSSRFHRLADVLAPHSHVHLHAERVCEVLPWLDLATRADPSQVEAYRSAAFWLAGEAQRPDEAFRVLAEGRRRNPGDYRLLLDTGRLHLQRGQPGAAARWFEAAQRAWDRGPPPDSLGARQEQAELLLYRGLLFEGRGDRLRAQACYRNLLALFPGREGVRARLEALETAGRAEPEPAALWREVLQQRDRGCSREHAGGL